MNITCPNCHRRLRVPDGAVGRRARCPACRTKFVVARNDDEMFETITGYVMEDIEDQAHDPPKNTSNDSSKEKK